MEEEFGTLQIRVYTSRAQLPIEDATVVVTQISPTGKYHLLSVQITDREGRVQPLTIPAPLLVALMQRIDHRGKKK